MTLDDARPMLLVADDDDDLLEEASHWLGRAGYAVRVARHGGEAIGALQGGLRPSVIILDLMMPVTSGWDVWDWLQQSAARDVPVIVWTATGLSQGAVGSARVVQKGRDPQGLLTAIRELLGPAQQDPAQPTVEDTARGVVMATATVVAAADVTEPPAP